MYTLAHEILKLCDQVRDDVLPNLGVRLEDHDGMPVTITISVNKKNACFQHKNDLAVFFSVRDV